MKRCLILIVVLFLFLLSVPAMTETDSEGNIIGEPRYDVIRPFANGNFLAKEKWNYGVVDPEGNIVVDFEYLEIRYSEDHTLHPFNLRGKWGFMDDDGNHVVEALYDDVSSMSDWAWVRVDSKYDVYQKYGVIDADGNVLFEPQFDSVPAMYQDYAIVEIDGKYGVIAPDGSYILDVVYDRIWNWGTYYEPIPISLNGQWGYMNVSGDWFLPPVYEDAYGFSKKGLACAKSGGLWGLIDQSGAYVIKPVYESIRPVQEEYYMVQIGGKWGVIDFSGSYLIKPLFDEMHESDSCEVSKYGTWIYTEEEYHAVQGDREYYFDIVDGKIIPGGEGEAW